MGGRKKLIYIQIELPIVITTACFGRTVRWRPAEETGKERPNGGLPLAESAVCDGRKKRQRGRVSSIDYPAAYKSDAILAPRGGCGGRDIVWDCGKIARQCGNVGHCGDAGQCITSLEPTLVVQ